MKKVIALILVLLLGLVVILTNEAMAESFSFDGLTNEELLELFDEVQNEVVSRGIEKTATLSMGVYVGGIDIPVGSYCFVGDGEEDDSGGFYYYSDNSMAKSFSEFINGDEYHEYYVTVETGDIVRIPYQFKATICAGIMFE